MSNAMEPRQEQMKIIRSLLQKFRVESHLVDVSNGQHHDIESTVLHRQQAVELQRHLHGFHIADVMNSKFISFRPEDNADSAACAFERYDLVSAPVVNERGKLLGRLTVDAVMDPESHGVGPCNGLQCYSYRGDRCFGLSCFSHTCSLVSGVVINSFH